MISVVVVNYNTKNLMRECLQSLQPLADLQVIVVDNASGDGSVDMVRREFSSVELIANAENLGFAAANNQGFKLAEGDYILMLNSDAAITDAQTLPVLVAELESDDKIGVVAPQLRNGKGEVQASASWRDPNLLSVLWEHTLLNRVFNKLFRRYPGRLLLAPTDQARPNNVGDLLGACLLFRRSLLQQIGGLDERFFIFLEETDFNLRVRQHDLRLRYLPTVAVLHHWGSSIDSAGSLARRFALFYPSLYKFFHKQHGLTYAALAYLITLLGSLWSLAVVLLAVIPATIVGKRQAVTGQLPYVLGTLKWHLGARG